MELNRRRAAMGPPDRRSHCVGRAQLPHAGRRRVLRGEPLLMSTAAVVIGVSLVIALVFAVRRCYRPENRYRRAIPNLARARERPRSGRLERQVLLTLITPGAVAAAVAVRRRPRRWLTWTH